MLVVGHRTLLGQSVHFRNLRRAQGIRRNRYTFVDAESLGISRQRSAGEDMVGRCYGIVDMAGMGLVTHDPVRAGPEGAHAVPEPETHIAEIGARRRPVEALALKTSYT